MATATFPRCYQSNCSPASGQLTADPKMILATQHYWFFPLFIFFIDRDCLVHSTPSYVYMYIVQIQRFSIALLLPPCWLSPTPSSSSPTSGRQSGGLLANISPPNQFDPRSHDVLLSGEALLAFSFATNLFDKLVKVGTNQIDQNGML